MKRIFTSAAVIISNAVNLLAGSKSQVTPAPKPTVTLSYKRMNTDVTLKSGLTGAVIYYTLDGSTPTTGSTVYTEPFNVTAETTVKAVVIADGYLLSDVAEQVVDLKDQALEPTIDVAYLLCRGHPHRARRADRHQHRQPPVVLPTDRLHLERTAGGKGRPKGDLHH